MISEVAVIDEAACIGCTLCLAACPVDAIVGATKRMHTVIADQCTGCRLCLPPCPVDCIAMVEATGDRAPERARQREAARTARLERERAERHAADLRKTAALRKQATIERAMQRARQRLQERQKRDD